MYHEQLTCELGNEMRAKTRLHTRALTAGTKTQKAKVGLILIRGTQEDPGRPSRTSAGLVLSLVFDLVFGLALLVPLGQNQIQTGQKPGQTHGSRMPFQQKVRF